MTAVIKDGAAAMGYFLRDIRVHRGLLQDTLAAKSGLSTNHVGVLERGEVQSPGLLSVVQVARALEVSAAAFAVAFTHPSDPSEARRWVMHASPSLRSRQTHSALALGSALESLRERRNLGQATLARRAGVGRTTVRTLEQGLREDPQLLSLVKLARAVSGEYADRHAHHRTLCFLVLAFTGYELTRPMGAAEVGQPLHPISTDHFCTA